MKLIRTVACSLLAGVSIVSVLASETDGDQLMVLKQGAIVYVRSSIDEGKDVVIQMRVHPNFQHMIFGETFIVPSETPMNPTALDRSKWMFHTASGDVTPWSINGTLIGASNGVNAALRLPQSGGSISHQDIGSQWTDADGTSFYLVGIEEGESLLFLSENKATAPDWKFISTIAGGELQRRQDGFSLPSAKAELAQFRPANRIESQRYLADGEPLEEGVAISCQRFDVVETYDILNPASMLEWIQQNPGKLPDLSSPKIQPVLTNHLVYQFQPRGACVIEYRVTAHQNFQLGPTALVQALPLGAKGEGSLAYLIPKTLPFTREGIDYEFDAVQSIGGPLREGFSFASQYHNITDPGNPPDRFIQLLKQDDQEVGLAIGYSLLEGITTPQERSENAKPALIINPSRTLYPVAISQKADGIRAGDTFEGIAYRQYFPLQNSSEATAVYGHYQKDAYLLYAEFHKPVGQALLAVPAGLEGKSFEVVEKSDSVTLLSPEKVGPGGISISVANDRGSIVVKIDGARGK